MRRRGRPKGSSRLAPEVVARLGDANLMYAMGRYSEAIPLLEAVIREAPAVPDSYQTLALVYDALGERRKAVNLTMIAAHITPQDTALWRRLAAWSLTACTAWMHLSRLPPHGPLLLTRLYQVVRRDPSGVEAWWEQALLLPEAQAGQVALLSGGVDHCRPAQHPSSRPSPPSQVVRRDPSDVEARWEQALLLAEAGDYRRAAAALELMRAHREADGQREADGEVCKMLARVSEMPWERVRCLERWAHPPSCHPFPPPFQMYHRIDQSDKAIEVLQSLLASATPSTAPAAQLDLTALNILAELYITKGSFQEALAVVERGEGVAVSGGGPAGGPGRQGGHLPRAPGPAHRRSATASEGQGGAAEALWQEVEGRAAVWVKLGAACAAAGRVDDAVLILHRGVLWALHCRARVAQVVKAGAGRESEWDSPFPLAFFIPSPSSSPRLLHLLASHPFHPPPARASDSVGLPGGAPVVGRPWMRQLKALLAEQAREGKEGLYRGLKLRLPRGIAVGIVRLLPSHALLLSPPLMPSRALSSHHAITHPLPAPHFSPSSHTPSPLSLLPALFPLPPPSTPSSPPTRTNPTSCQLANRRRLARLAAEEAGEAGGAGGGEGRGGRGGRSGRRRGGEGRWWSGGDWHRLSAAAARGGGRSEVREKRGGGANEEKIEVGRVVGRKARKESTHSPLNMHHSPLNMHHSPLNMHHSPLNMHHSPSTSISHPSTCISHPSTCITHPSTCITHPSTCITHPSTCISHPSTSITHPSTCISHPSTCISHPQHASLTLNMHHSPLNIHHSPLNMHHSPLNMHHSPLNMHHSPLNMHHSPLNMHHSPLNMHLSPLNMHHSPLNMHHSPLNMHHSPLNMHLSLNMHHSPLNMHLSPHNMHHSPLNMHHSPLNMHLSPLNMHHSPSTCISHPSTCITHPSTCISHPSTCITHPSTCLSHPQHASLTP
ncbi:unnamed protein product [Closterium sp. Yama58-4]|nr:unnamed protein product [Closterium sp. Yama58-4]